MNLSYLIRLTLIFMFLMTIASGRTLSHNRMNDDDDNDNDDNKNGEMTKSTSSEYSDDEDIFPKDFSEMINFDNAKEESADSYEERLFHQRALQPSSSRAPRMISAQTRQALIDIIQKAYDNGWRPKLKHYIPATRFGRHR